MAIALGFVLTILGALIITAQNRPEPPHRQALKLGWTQLRPLLLRLPLALLAAAFIAQLLPEQAIAELFGEDSGWRGVLIASILGVTLPGGPMVAFPLIIVFHDAGAGISQLIALLTSWSLLGLHRMAAHEIPMLGTQFTLARAAASLPLPAVAGYCTGAVAQWIY